MSLSVFITFLEISECKSVEINGEDLVAEVQDQIKKLFNIKRPIEIIFEDEELKEQIKVRETDMMHDSYVYVRLIKKIYKSKSVDPVFKYRFEPFIDSGS